MGSENELETIPFEVLEKWKQEAKDNKHFPGKGGRSSLVLKKRQNKNCPMEISSKSPVSTFKDICVEGIAKKSRDPRFDTSSGNFSKSKFRKNFSFLYEEELPKEEQELEKQIKESKSKDERHTLKKELNRVKTAIHEEHERRLNEKISRRLKSQVSIALKEGKRPYYLKRRDRQQMHLIEKYKKLKNDGELDKFMEKKRKKIAKSKNLNKR